jgi:hypothetical protein
MGAGLGSRWEAHEGSVTPFRLAVMIGTPFNPFNPFNPFLPSRPHLQHDHINVFHRLCVTSIIPL